MLREQVKGNNKELMEYLLLHTNHGIKVSVDFNLAWGETESKMLPPLYAPLVQEWNAIQFKAEVEVVVRTAAFGLYFWARYLVSNSFD